MPKDELMSGWAPLVAHPEHTKERANERTVYNVRFTELICTLFDS